MFARAVNSPRQPRKEPQVGQVVSQDDLILVVAGRKRNGQRVVFTNGCFELLHPGHIRCLERARALGDLLVVAINSDASARQIKGDPRPLVPQEERAEILAALAAVDYVAIFNAPTPREMIARLLPDVLVKGGDWGPEEIVGREEVEAAGGCVVSVPLEPGYSTSGILERLRNL
jgi:D-beta-D-heptose 7-phosphate kinase/D-beta-D-heptose 1-phosphate adenosyltransferase